MTRKAEKTTTKKDKPKVKKETLKDLEAKDAGKLKGGIPTGSRRFG